MSYSNNLIHCVWGTMRRIPFITRSNRAQIIEHIRKYSEEKGIHIDFINGHIDHLHCLLSLNATQALSSVVMTIRDQDIHHRKKSWNQEQQEFIRSIDHYSQQFRWDKISD